MAAVVALPAAERKQFGVGEWTGCHARGRKAGEFAPVHFSRRISSHEVKNFEELYRTLNPGELLTRTHDRSGLIMSSSIQQCVKDVLFIANHSEDFIEAKKRIERLFVQSKAQHRRRGAVAQRLRDQIYEAYNDVPVLAQVCLDRVLDWLDREHLARNK